MEILLVDDDVTVVNGIEKGIQWETLGISKLWKAYSAKAAKSMIQNGNIDILLCDIEMPGENGLSLCRWIRENSLDIECILLTAHADFEFAKEAVNLRIFDYILQPARYQDIQNVLCNVIEQIKKKRDQRRFYQIGKLFNSKKQSILADIIKKWVWNEYNSGEVIHELRALDYSVDEKNPVCCSVIQIQQWKNENTKLDSTSFSFVTGNIVQELLTELGVVVICTCLERGIFSCIILGDKGAMPQIWNIKMKLSRYIDVVFQLYGCKTVCFLDDIIEFEAAAKSINNLEEIRLINKNRKSGVYCIFEQEKEEHEEKVIFEDLKDAYVEAAVQYVKCNIEERLSRKDIAEAINISEDYLSHIFKLKKGVSLKQFIINEKMETAKILLKTTSLPVGVIAVSIGYDNFSHFSSTYRMVMGLTPMEERELK